MELTSRERILRTHLRQEVDRMPMVDKPWAGTLRRWKREGMPEEADWIEHFGYDRIIRVCPDNSPRFPVRVLEENERSKVVYYSKPRADLVTVPGPLNEEAIRADFKRICECAPGCLFEIGQREVMTLHGDADRGRRYVELAKECVGRYWRP